jgi:hypothetical protein
MIDGPWLIVILMPWLPGWRNIIVCWISAFVRAGSATSCIGPRVPRQVI